MLRWLGLPVEASAHAARIDLIIALVHWLMLAMFVGWTIFFVYVLVRFRRGAHPKARYEAPPADWLASPRLASSPPKSFLLVFFSIPTWSARVDCVSRGAAGDRRRVVAEQFIWNIQYPGPTVCSAARVVIWSGRTIRSASTSAIPRRAMMCGPRIS
jgi:heme/copper-type cytochrome/quinol oxidase subunit 2